MSHAVSPHVLLATALGGMCCIGTLGQCYQKNTGDGQMQIRPFPQLHLLIRLINGALSSLTSVGFLLCD